MATVAIDRSSKLPEVLIYMGAGTSTLSRESVTRSLGQVCRRDVSIRPILSDEITTSDFWHTSAALMVVPGGADLDYCRELNGQGNASIQRFVTSGGSYLGICGGSYYGARRVSFEAESKNPIIEERELRFFPGCAHGSIHEYASPYVVNRLECSTLVELTREDGGVPATQLVYWGGPRFNPDEGEDDFDVLARYTRLPPPNIAGVRMRIGKGTVVLCGVHPEISGEDYEAELTRYVNGIDERFQQYARTLRQKERQRLEFFRSLLVDADILRLLENT